MHRLLFWQVQILACALLFCGLGTVSMAAETRAVLVGVSDYTFLDVDLAGPRNDVRLFAQTLVDRKVLPEHITVLTDTPAGLAAGIKTALPTRQNILQALDDLALKGQPGDTAVFYFSGHGAQMPDANGDEQGGYDEIFLPSDARKWNGSIGTVENAIIDDELQQKALAILKTGTKLVAILDACHSGTGFRAVPSKSVERYLDPAVLGVPENPDEQATRMPETALPGSFVFLYSSQSNQRSFEYPLGTDDATEEWYGDFTRNLVLALRRQPDLSYGQLLQATRDTMRGDLATATQTPDGEGTMLDEPVFGSQTVLPALIEVRQGILQAGLLSGLTKGSVVQVFDSADGGQPVGTAVLAAPTANTTEIFMDGATDLPAKAYASLLRPAPPSPLVLSFPVTLDQFDGYDYREILAALETLAANAAIPGATFRDAGADITLILTDGTVAIAGPDGVLDPNGAASSPRIPIDRAQDIAAQLSGWLLRFVHAQRLRTALNAAEGAGSGGLRASSSKLKIKLETREGTEKGDGCTTQKGSEKVNFRDGGILNHCDELWLSLQNPSLKAQDVTVLYIDLDYTINTLWPLNNLSNRLGSAENKSMGFQIRNPLPKNGIPRRAFEELIVISISADPGAARIVLSGLSSNQTTRATASDALRSYLYDALRGDVTTRAVLGSKPISPLTVSRFRFEVLPQTSNQ